MAYRLKESTVIRAGFGVFHALNTGGATLGSLTSTLPYFVNATVVSSNTTPQLFLNELFPTPDKVAGAVTSNQDLGRRTGYIYQYNFTIQHQLRPNLLLETGYLGNTGQKQVGTVWVNQPRLPENPAAPTPFAARAPYPNLSPVFSQNTNYQWSNYNAGYVKLEQRLAAWTLLQCRLHVLRKHWIVAGRGRICTIAGRSADSPITTCAITSSAVGYTTFP